MQVWIGTSGYSYPDWVGSLYPAGTRPQRMLGHYCRVFPLVELNFTYYRPPTPGMLTRFARQTPSLFQFLVKLPRTLSHEEHIRDLLGFRHAVDALKNEGKSSSVLNVICEGCIRNIERCAGRDATGLPNGLRSERLRLVVRRIYQKLIGACGCAGEIPGHANLVAVTNWENQQVCV